MKIIDNHPLNPFLFFILHFRLERFLEIIYTDEYIYIIYVNFENL